MEAVTAIASVAGIVSLVGQTIESIIKLRVFYQDCSEASNSIGRFLKALNGLIQIHENVRDLVKKLEDSMAVDLDKNILASLQIQIEDCGKDVGIWLEKACACQPMSEMSGTGTRASFRKFLIALEKKKIVDIYQEIENHKNNISTKLSVIGRHMDIDQSVILDKISAKIDQVAESQKSAFAESIALYGPKDGLDERSTSLSSIADSLNRIEQALGSRHESFGSHSSRGPIPYNEADTITQSFQQTGHILGPMSTKQSSDLFSCGDVECKLRFMSATSLRIHETRKHDMHWKENSPFLCTYKGCENYVPGNSFPRYSDLRYHLKRMHNDISFPETFTKESDPKELDSLFLEKLGCCLSPQLNAYIRLILVRSAMQMSHEGLSSLRWLFSEKTEKDGSLHELERISTKAFHRLQSEVARIRETCWREGQNVDDVDIILKVREGYNSTTPWEPPLQPSTEKKEENDPAPGERFEGERIKLEASKMDRINLWLLENLLAVPSEATHHRSYLPGKLHDDSQEWTRAILKYWLLDGAAAEQRNQTISTNGAVDSAGMCHSARVVLGNDIPIPIVDRTKGDPPKTAVPRNLEKDNIITDSVEYRNSWTSGHAAMGLAHRQKRRKRACSE